MCMCVHTSLTHFNLIFGALEKRVFALNHVTQFAPSGSERRSFYSAR